MKNENHFTAENHFQGFMTAYLREKAPLVWDDHIRTWLGIILDPAHLDYGTQNLGRRRSLFDHNV